MLEWEVAVSQVVVAPEVKSDKIETDFERQNPAARRLVKEVSDALGLMFKSLAKEINEVLTPNSD